MLKLYPLFFLLCPMNVNGDFENPFLEAFEPPADGVVVNPSQGSLEVRENIPEENEVTSIAKIRVTGLDPVIISSIVPTFEGLQLRQVESEWHLVLVKPFDAETEALYFMTLRQGTNPTTASVFISVVDVNDNPCRIVNDPELLLNNPFDEHKEPIPGQNISWVDAEDPDAVDKGKLTFSFEHVIGKPASGLPPIFRMNPTTGQLFLERELDYATASMHRLKLIVNDSDNIHTDSVTINLEVRDLPDRPPAFVRLPASLNVDEGTVGVIDSVEARDQDLALDWEIRYSLLEEHTTLPVKYFEINATTGEIFVNGEIDAEALLEYEGSLFFTLTIIAKEIAGPGYDADLEQEISGTISVTIRDINDNAPEICEVDPEELEFTTICKSRQEYSLSLAENSVGTLELDPPFVVRDKDSTYAYSQFSVTFDPTTPEKIRKAFRVQPPSGASITKFTILIVDSSQLDYDDTDGFWWDNSTGVFLPKEQTFNIFISEGTVVAATVQITLTLLDENDNDPEFPVGSYEFYVCEGTEAGTVLTGRRPGPGNSVLCRESSDSGLPVRVEATDKDISPEYREIRYGWNSRANKPPVILDERDGTMKMNGSAKNFDYERFPEEDFILLASDTGGRSSQITVTFMILDKNDEPVQLSLGSTSQLQVDEGISNPNYVVLPGITARDVDTSPKIKLTFELATVFLAEEAIPIALDDQETIRGWFQLQIDDSSPNEYSANLTLTNTIINRELNEAGVDRVDLVISAVDENSETENDALVTQTITIRINDINDNPPTWEGISGSDELLLYLQETRVPDEENAIQREIYTFRARDKDLNSAFIFDYTVRDCVAFCEEYKELVELSSDSSLGRAVLSRRENVLIDREEEKFFGIPTDFLNYTVSVSDSADQSANTITVDVCISILDLNDNVPEWVGEYDKVPYYVSELAVDAPVETFLATDKDKIDKYGLITYRFDKDVAPPYFAIDGATGLLTANGPFKWEDVNRFEINVAAIDNYASGSLIESNTITTKITVIINDENTNAPEFTNDNASPLVEIPETWPIVDQPLNETLIVIDKDDPTLGNGQFDVSIIGVSKDGSPLPSPLPFKTGPLRDGSAPGTKLVPIIPTKRFEGDWGTYSVQFEAKDKGAPQLVSQKDYTVVIKSENLNTPEFVFPRSSNDTTVIVSYNSATGDLRDYMGVILPKINATDKDDPGTGNGQVEYTTIPNPDMEDEEMEEDKGYGYIGVNPSTNQLSLSNPFDNADVQFYNLYIKAEDKGEQPRSSISKMKVFLLPESNRPPHFNDTTPLNISIVENALGITHEIMAAYDPDFEFNDPNLPPIQTEIFYHVVGGSKDYFTVIVTNDTLDPRPFLKTIQQLDREAIKSHTIVVFASNDPTPPPQDTAPENIPKDSKEYLVVYIEVENLFDTAPEFPQVENGGIISGGFSTNNNRDDPIMLIETTDLDDFDYVTFKISSEITYSDPTLDIGNPFSLAQVLGSNTSANLVINFTPQLNMKGYFTFYITATDLGELSSTVQFKIYMIKQNNVVRFKFLKKYEEVLQLSSRLAAVLSSAFGYRCNIDRVFSDEQASDTTIVNTHFIDLETNEPVPAVLIEEQQFDPEVYRKLGTGLTEIGMTLAKDGIGNPQGTLDDGDQLTVYLLMGAIGILGVGLIVLATTCYFNNRSLSRRVRSLTATTFGSQTSGLNRAGAALDLPNTNEFAIQGSNPMWTTDPGQEKKVRELDAESVGSGGSVLIGVEEDEDFRNYQEEKNNSASEDDEDLYGRGGGSNGNNAAYQSSNPSSSEEDEREQRFDSEMGPPLGFGDSSVRRNPLADMGFDDEA